ncbi:hypothetical protein [Paludibaculum fermentans]|uniref:Uncharacterized protein n=1 Tax=Paludibaculum fermentans TaxID=1473598 RepID=A0A7S7NR13_PALFE|nr:hypothetical protein [Paludibaculum fermentans]QOY88231.1 hypothetical protein IRI77_36765 [Paludibaculum fermentans]
MNAEATMYSFKLRPATLAKLDVLARALGLHSRGSVLDRAVTSLWRKKIEITQYAGLWSPVTDGSREDEILRRLHDMARIEFRSMADVAEEAIDGLLEQSLKAA